jgi:long-chain fatty acid transport protein
MKKKILLLSIIVAGMANAASVDYLMNNSTSYFQNPAQTAQISVEGVFYNPAGTVFVDDGLYLNVNAQNSIINESMKVEGKTFDAKSFAAVPSFNLLYKKNNYSLFANASVIGGGATLEYEGGTAGVYLAAAALNANDPFKGTARGLNANLSGGKFIGENRYYQGIIGGAYKINDKLSVSLGGKYVYATRKLEGTADYTYNASSPMGRYLQGNTLSIDSTRKADGVGFSIGADYKLNETTNFAVKYDSRVRLTFETKAIEANKMIFMGRTLGISAFYPTYANGVKKERDLPGVLSLGASKSIGKATYSIGYNHYYNKAANIDGIEYQDGFEANIGIDYKLNEKITLHGGFNFADTGAKPSTYNDTEYAVNSQIYATGLTYKPNENNEWKFSLAYISYNSENGEDTPSVIGTLEKSKVKYDKAIGVFGIGYTHKF